MKNFTKILSIVLAMVLLLSLAACKKEVPEETKPVETKPVESKPVETDPEVDVKPVKYFSMSLSSDPEHTTSLSAYVVDETASTAFVEYIGAERKMGDLEFALLDKVAEAIAKANVAALDGKSEYEDGEASASMYIEFTDGTMISADFAGVIPDDFTKAFESMEACIQEITADMPVYVPEPVVMGEVNAEALAEIQAILSGSGLPNLDTFGISDVPNDDSFGFVMGLSSAEGIVNGTSCAGMMMTTAYSLVIATVEDTANIEKVREDFQNSVDWGKWVCVRPTDALIAQKGNMVLCLVAADDLFTGTQAGIEAAGWENITAFKEQ